MPGKKKTHTTQKVPEVLRELYERRFFAEEKTFDQIKQELKETAGHNPRTNTLRVALGRAEYLAKHRSKYVQKYPPTKVALSNEVFPEELTKLLEQDFKTELKDLRLNYGASGNCTAFLLRKILEKLIFITFAKHGQDQKLRGPNGNFVSLTPMLKLATECKVNGKPYLMPKTAQEIGGIKFLGDTSAHNPLVDVSMRTIELAMPYITTAYLELSKKL